MTFPLMSVPLSPLPPLFSHRNVSLPRHDSSLVNFDLKTAIDDGDKEFVGELFVAVGEEEVLVISVVNGSDDSSMDGCGSDDRVNDNE